MATHRTKMTLREWALLAFGLVGLVCLLWASFLLGEVSSRPAAAADPITVTTPQATTTGTPLTPAPDLTPSVDMDIAPAPGMIPWFAPPDGPAPDSPPYDVDVVSVRDEFRTHGVDTPNEKLPLMLAMINRHIARGDPDLDAWDVQIAHDVRELYPDLRRALVIDVTRCFAEYVERVEARNAGLAAPPDSDDHGVTVDNRGPQARITKQPITAPTS